MSEQGVVRVLIVDDTDDIRLVVRLALELDGRYEVVGEAADGLEGIVAAESLRPDVILLDLAMPRMDGLTALPKIRQVAPATPVVLYTTQDDARVHQAAVAAGALDVMEKGSSIGEIGTLLADVLVRSASGSADPTVKIGPVPSDSALDWITNTRKIVEAVRREPDAADLDIEAAVFETFDGYLDTWQQVAEANAEFLWAARAPAAQVELLVDAWASIDRIDEERLRALGCSWSSPLGRAFFEALTSAVLEMLSAHEATVALARRLAPQWAPPAA